MGDFSVGCRCFTTTPCPWATHDAATSAATIVNSFSVFMYFPLEPALDRTLGFRHISSRTKERMDRKVGERRTGAPAARAIAGWTYRVGGNSDSGLVVNHGWNATPVVVVAQESL